MKNSALRFMLRFVLRRSLAIVIVAVLSAVPCAYWTAKLYGNLKPDIEELLPRQSRSILDLGEIRARLLSVQHLAIIVHSQDTEGSKRFVTDLAEKLSQVKDGSIASVEYRIDRELRFFNERKALFIEVADLTRIRNFIRDRIDYEIKMRNPLNIFSGVNIPEPRFDFLGLQHRYLTRAQGFDHFPGGFYATANQTKRLVLVNLPSNQSGIAGIHALKNSVLKTIGAMNLSSYAKDLDIKYSGDVQDIIEEQDALIHDIEVSAEIVFAIVVVALILFFRSFLATFALFASLFIARFWTFGASWFLVGSLNANSAFMGSIVLGSGITFGVMLLSRYLEERRKGRVPLRAARIAMTHTTRATLTAALAAGVAYGSLFLTSFEGFKQYGIIGGIGMIFCWISSVVVFPALLLQIERVRKIVRGPPRARSQWIFGPLSRVLGRYPGAILVGFCILTLLSIASFARFSTDNVIENNLENLRSRTSMRSGSGFYNKEVNEVLQYALSPAVSLVYSPESAEEVAARLRKIIETDGPQSLMTSVHTLEEFVPRLQDEKIKLLRDIQRLLPPPIFSRLSSEERKQVNDFLGPEAFKPFTQRDLPPLIVSKFTEKDGSVGKLVLVDPPFECGSWAAEKLNRFVNTIRRVSDEVDGRKVPVAGTLAVTSDMMESILKDGPRATLFAFLGVVILIFFLFRQLRIAMLMLFAMILGNLWLFGWVLGTGFKINFLNFIALPITFGIGVDYGVNIFHRYLHEKDGDILRVVRETGGAVGLCSFTTNVGYGSLIIAQNQAFVSFGTLAVIGELTSLAAAVVALPALLLVLQRRKSAAVLTRAHSGL